MCSMCPPTIPPSKVRSTAAVNGDTIFIAAGTYNESDLFIEDANIVITGEVNAEGEPLVTIDGGGDSNILIAIGVVGATGATVENIVFTGSTGKRALDLSP